MLARNALAAIGGVTKRDTRARRRVEWFGFADSVAQHEWAGPRNWDGRATGPL